MSRHSDSQIVPAACHMLCSQRLHLALLFDMHSRYRVGEKNMKSLGPEDSVT